MFRNYVTVALRNLGKRRGYAFINIAGLGLGIAASILILLYARHELTYDRFHERADRIYEVYKERHTPTGTQITRDTWVPLAERLEAEYPAVENATRFFTQDDWIEHEGVRFQEPVTYTDPDLFDVFTFPLAKGDPSALFRDLNSVVLSTDAAHKYFGEADPLGQVLRIGGMNDYTVTGVLAPIPSNSTLQIDFAIPLASVPNYAELAASFGSSFLSTYVLLDPKATPEALEAQFPDLIARLWDAEEAGRTTFRLQALPTLYDALNGNRVYAYLLIGIALAILLIACINFMNLATARSMDRAREVGMRKVLGAGRGQLARQFLGESLLLSLLALVLGVLVAEAALPFFNDLYGLDLGLGVLQQPVVLLALLGLGLVVGLAAGSYPAFVLSSFRPIAALQGRRQGGPGGLRLRHALVVTQFTLAVALIMGTLVVRDQIAYMKEADLNFDRENLVAIGVGLGDFEDREEAAVRLETFKQTLRRQPGVTAVTSSSHIPGDWPGWFAFVYPGDGGEEDRLRMRLSYADADFFETYGIPFIEGRPFDEARATDRDAAVVLNEAAVKAFGWERGAGQTIRIREMRLEVVGVVADYHFESLQNEVAPVLHFFRQPDNAVHNYVSVRFGAGAAPGVLAGMEARWRDLDPTRPLPYTFVDQQFAQQYQAEERLGTVAGTFTTLAILIACLGLFGLASWMTSQRVKEIGVRKVLGATVPGIVLLLSKDFAKLVLVGVVLAVPIAYFGMNAWLEGFAYRVEISWWTFLLAGLAALLVALATVSYQSVRSALDDPAQSLRYE